ncbi:type II secretion system protein GspL [Endozoicomonas atrinae]|uniref:type II secretion system protein GspL n=1 Tax=Endozoicomonas atrinae TaxID=1333660 RepID=UPI000825DA21|nr:type II secretion system protein GspL [Endozoicomonas atrinae]
MNPHLLLRLPEHPDQPVYWLLFSTETSNEEQCIANGSWPTASDFIAEYADTTVTSGMLSGQPIAAMTATVLVPAARVTLHTLSLQGRLTPAVRQSLPWRLEEELSDDVEDLHFAILHHGDNQAHLAVMQQADMAQWQGWLMDAGVISKRWVPDALMLPVEENQCRLLTIDDLIIARYGQWQIAACESQWLTLFMEGLKKEQPELEFSEAELHSASPLTLLAPQASNTQLNLLQGQWQPASPWHQRLLPWWSSALMASLLFIMLTVNSVLDTHQLEQTAASYQQQANGIYQQLFPGERVVRLQSQMRQKLAALQQPEESSKSMLTMLARITPVLNTFPELKANSMAFSVNDRDGARQSLRIQAQASDFELFTRFREQFEKELNRGSDKGLTIAIEALERTGDKVTGMLVISGGVS